MLCSASLTQCSSCDRGFTGLGNQPSPWGLWLRLALAPCGHHAHPRVTGGMLRCIELHAKRGGKVDSTKAEKKKKSQRE